MDYEKKYKEALEWARKVIQGKVGFVLDEVLEKFPELKESRDERIKNEIKLILANTDLSQFALDYTFADMLAWLEKQGDEKNKINSYKITFEDVLVLECAMNSTKFIEGCDKLYEKLVPLYNKIHNAYLVEKKGEHKQDPCHTCDHPTMSCNRFPCEKKQAERKPVTDFSDLRTWKYIVDAVWTEKEGIGQYLDSPFTEEVAKKLQKRFGNIEQNPVDKVKPIFNVGDWVVLPTSDGEKVVQIDSIEYFKSGEPRYITSEGRWFGNGTEVYLWTMRDAKDGDVLACENGWTCIFKTLVNDETFSSYCFMDNTKWFCEIGSEGHTLKEEFDKVYNGKIYPATKEQCDALFKRMHEAGYKWDAEKKELKELKKIEKKQIVDIEIPYGAKDSELQEVSYHIPEGSNTQIALWPKN